MTIPSIYALYQGDEYIYSGTIREISSHTGLSIGNLKNLATPSYKKRFNDENSKYWVVKLEDEEI